MVVGVGIALVAVRGLTQVRHMTTYRIEQRRQKGRKQYRLDESGRGLRLTVGIDLLALAMGVVCFFVGVTSL